jgi:hypothetical protein
VIPPNYKNIHGGIIMTKLTKIIQSASALAIAGGLLFSGDANAQAAKKAAPVPPPAPTAPAPTKKPGPVIIPQSAIQYNPVTTPTTGGTGPTPGWKPNADARSFSDFNATSFFPIYRAITGNDKIGTAEGMFGATVTHILGQDLKTAIAQYDWMSGLNKVRDTKEMKFGERVKSVLAGIQTTHLIDKMENASTALASLRAHQSYNATVGKNYQVGISATNDLGEALVRVAGQVVHFDFKKGEINTNDKAPDKMERTSGRKGAELIPHYHAKAFTEVQEDLKNAPTEAGRQGIIQSYVNTGEAQYDPIFAGFMTKVGEFGKRASVGSNTLTHPLETSLEALFYAVPAAADEAMQGLVTIESLRKGPTSFDGYAIPALRQLVGTATGSTDETKLGYTSALDTLVEEPTTQVIKAVFGQRSNMQDLATNVTGSKVRYQK